MEYNLEQSEARLKRAEETFEDAQLELLLSKSGEGDLGKKEAQEVWDWAKLQMEKEADEVVLAKAHLDTPADDSESPEVAEA